MGIEGGGFSIESGGSDSLEHLLEAKQEVFDSELDVEAPTSPAQKSAIEVAEELESIPWGFVKQLENSRVEAVDNGGSKPDIVISWNNSGNSVLLRPFAEGVGIEAFVYNYRFHYGKTSDLKKGDVRGAVGDRELFGVPDWANLLILPTSVRWAVGEDFFSKASGVDNTRSLYVGLGLLMLSEKFLLVGCHEAGHLGETSMAESNGENKAWENAARYYAAHAHDSNSAGRFGLLQPKVLGDGLSIGVIERWGLESHYLAGTPGVRLPDQWRDGQRAAKIENKKERLWKPDIGESQREFSKVIKAAQEAYDGSLGSQLLSGNWYDF